MLSSLIYRAGCSSTQKGIVLGIFLATHPLVLGQSGSGAQSGKPMTPIAITPEAVNPSAPQNVTAVAGNGQATVSFSPPASDGGAPIMTYVATSNPGGSNATGSSSPLVVTGLTNGSSYTFTVVATNSAFDTGPGGTSNSVTPKAVVPGAPQNVVATAGNGQATISFSPPANDGGAPVNSYMVTSSPGGFIASGSSGPLTITGLTDGVAYTFTVTATNSTGTGPSSASNSVTPQATPPGAPQSVSATAGNAQASISFSPPANNGGASVTGYTVTSSPAGLTSSGSSGPLTVTGLTNGAAYTFTVTATNSAGTGPVSAASNSVIPATLPGAPQNVSAAAGNGQATISFSAPANNGGAAIISYSVTASPGGLSASGSGSPLTVTGLSDGTAYTFSVTATNSVGAGPASVASNSVTPQAGLPGAPQNVSATAASGQATISFTAPASNGGAAITNYTVSSSPGGITANGAASPITIAGLNNGTAYTFTVTASNSSGTGPASAATNSVTPLGAPGAPLNVTATAGNGQATINFSPPASNGGAVITGYNVTSSPAGFSVYANGSGGPVTITGLTNGTAYAFTVTATNGAGTGPASAASNSVTPATLPGAPQNVSAAAGNGQVAVSFAPPASNGGAAITTYTAVASPSGLSASGSGSPLTVTGLSNGTPYTFSVTATNSSGTGPASMASNSATPESSLPGAPQNVTAAAGNGQATVSFTAPASNGGAAITNYTVISSPSGLTVSGLTSPITVTGLSNGTAYTFTVTATNSTGPGPGSAASNSVTPTALPGAPQNVTATVGNGQATISFTAPANNGGAAITNYTVKSSPGGVTVSGAASPIIVTGLNNGTAYTFTVTATNSAGTGPASPASNSVTPAGLPGAPLNVTATASNGQATINFSPPSNNGGAAITGYTVTASPGGLTASGAASPLAIAGLTNGTSYTFTVTATNSAGTGPGSTASNSVTPATVPGAPQFVSAAALNGKAIVSFSAPASNGGAPVTSYTVTSSPGGFRASGASAPLTVNGLTNGTLYTFTVNATNSVGTGPGSSASNSVTPSSGVTLPGAPQNVTAVVSNGQATISFAAPVSDGGATITSYTVTSAPGGLTTSGPAGPLTITGLTNGTVYTFTVTATNSAGTGPASAPSNSVTPASVPGAPQNPAASAGNAQATVTFAPPASNGGSPINYYTVTSTPGGFSAQGPGSPLTVTGLSNGTGYTFSVTATNNIGTGPGSSTSNSVVPVAGVPGAPLSPMATAGDQDATIAFLAPLSDGGSPILSYTVTSSPGGLTASGPAPPLTVTGLTNGTSYVFTVTATNAIGTGPGSSTSNSVTPGSHKQLSLTSISNFPIGVVGSDYPLQILSANGGVAPYVFAITAGSLPPGLTFSTPQFNGIPSTAGVFSFDVTVTDASGDVATATGTITIRLPHPDLIISQSVLPFVLSTGSHGVPGPASVTVRSSDISQPIDFSVTVTPAVTWLDVTGGGATPGSVGIALDPSALQLTAADIPYQATINLSCIAPSPCAGTSQTILVNLTVNDPAPQLALTSTLLSFQVLVSNPTPVFQPLGVQNTGGGTIAISSIAPAASWLSVSGASESLTGGPAVPVTVTANPQGLSPGYYTSSIDVVSNAGPASVPVALRVLSTPNLTLAPSGVQFEASAGNAPGVTSGSFAVTVFGSSSVNWSASVLPGAGWLTVTNPQGTATANAPGVVSFSIDPVAAAGLAPQAYYATIRVVSAGVDDSPLDFEVVLNVTPASTPVKVNPSPAGLVFLYSGEGSLPAPQYVQVYASSAAPLTYQASASTPDGGNWLSVKAASGTASSGSPGQSAVLADPSALLPGIYRGAVSYALASAAVRTVNVTLIVFGPVPLNQIVCKPGKLVLTEVGLVENFQQAVAWPVELDAKVLDDCGNPVSGAQVTEIFSNGDPPLTLTAIAGSPGLFSGTWTPRSVSAQVGILTTATALNFPAASIQVTGQATVNGAPILAPNATLHIFNPIIGAALAPGTIVQIYGSDLGATGGQLDGHAAQHILGGNVGSDWRHSRATLLCEPGPNQRANSV